VTLSAAHSWIRVNITVAEAESLLLTKYRVYTNERTGDDHLACDEYSIPNHVKEHVDFITPTIQFDAIVKSKPKRREDGLQRREIAVRPVPGAHPKPDAVPQPQVTFSLANCNTYITPDCLRALYGFPNGTLNS
jgi:tripeptidyl-peptidase-1